MKRYDIYKRVFPDLGSPFDAEKMLNNVSHREMMIYLTEMNNLAKCRIGVDVEPIDYGKLSFSIFTPDAEVYFYAVESVFSEVANSFRPNNFKHLLN